MTMCSIHASNRRMPQKHRRSVIRPVQNALLLILFCFVVGAASTNDVVTSFDNVPTGSPSNIEVPPTPLPTLAPTVKHNATKAPAGPTITPTTSRPPHITGAPIVPTPVAPTPVEVPVPVAPTPVEAPVPVPVPVATPVEVPVPTPIAPTPIAPVTPSTPSAPVAPPAPTPQRGHVSIVKILAKTVAWLILILLSVVAFGAAMSHRYRIYYFLRTSYYTALGWPCSQWLRAQVSRVFGSSNYSSSSPMDVHTILFDNDMNEGLLMRESEYD